MYVDVSEVSNQDHYEAIKDYASCPICTGIVIDAEQCEKCENCFCKACITKWTQQSRTCPMCKDRHFRSKEASRIVKNMLCKLTFNCPNGNCDNKVPYEELLTHDKKCLTETVCCPMCSSQVKKSALKKKTYDELQLELNITKKQYEEIKADYDEMVNSNHNKRADKKNERYDKKNIIANSLLSQNQISSIGNNYQYNSRSEWNFNSNSLSQVSQMSNLNNQPNNQININSNLRINDLQENLENISVSSNNFKYGTFNDSVCTHFSSSFCHIFECCDRAYPCKVCHDNLQQQKHRRGKVAGIYCKKCKTIYPDKATKKCSKCGWTLYIKPLNNSNENNRESNRNGQDVDTFKNDRKRNNREREHRPK